MDIEPVDAVFSPRPPRKTKRSNRNLYAAILAFIVFDVALWYGWQHNYKSLDPVRRIVQFLHMAFSENLSQGDVDSSILNPKLAHSAASDRLPSANLHIEYPQTRAGSAADEVHNLVAEMRKPNAQVKCIAGYVFRVTSENGVTAYRQVHLSSGITPTCSGDFSGGRGRD